MLHLAKSIRSRLFVLTSLILLSIFFAVPDKPASACQMCVQLTGGLCVGCMFVGEGNTTCVPDQSTCSCTVSGSCGGRWGGLE
jgi:hypothetical protein